mgnify:FL=1
MEAEESGDSTTRVLLVEFRTQLQRTVDWLNSSPLDRLDRPTSGGSVADRAHGIAQSMVSQTESVVGGEPKVLPRLRAHGVGSQLSVVGSELASAIETADVHSVEIDLALMGYVSQLLELRRTSH